MANSQVIRSTSISIRRWYQVTNTATNTAVKVRGQTSSSAPPVICGATCCSVSMRQVDAMALEHVVAVEDFVQAVAAQNVAIQQRRRGCALFAPGQNVQSPDARRAVTHCPVPAYDR